MPPTGERGPYVDIVVRTLPGCEPGPCAPRDTVPSMEGQRWRRRDGLHGDWATCPFGCTPPRSQPSPSSLPFYFYSILSSPPPSPRRFFLTVWAFPSESSRDRVVRAGPGMGHVRVSRAVLRAGVRDWRRLAGGSRPVLSYGAGPVSRPAKLQPRGAGTWAGSGRLQSGCETRAGPGRGGADPVRVYESTPQFVRVLRERTCGIW